MKRILFVNACSTTHELSRTKLLCDAVLQKCFKDSVIDEIILEEIRLEPFNKRMLAKRNEAVQRHDFSDPLFQRAHQLQEADAVVIGAPYWDLSFPSMLKVWIEHCMVTNLTFRYTKTGVEGLCRAEQLIYVTTAGGYIMEPDWAYGYVESIAHMLGIHKTRRVHVQGLDLVGADVERLMAEGIGRI